MFERGKNVWIIVLYLKHYGACVSAYEYRPTCSKIAILPLVSERDVGQAISVNLI
jgi:hypothetical protein